MYETPTPDEIREFARRHNLTGRAAARIVGVDARTWRKWTAHEGAANRRSIPWSAWTLLRLWAGELTLDAYRDSTIQRTGTAG